MLARLEALPRHLKVRVVDGEVDDRGHVRVLHHRVGQGKGLGVELRRKLGRLCAVGVVLLRGLQPFLRQFVELQEKVVAGPRKLVQRVAQDFMNKPVRQGDVVPVNLDARNGGAVALFPKNFLPHLAQEGDSLDEVQIRRLIAPTLQALVAVGELTGKGIF